MKYTTGYKHQLCEDEACSTDIHPFITIDHKFFHLSIGGTLTVRAGYAWDGASGGCPDNKYTLTPSLFHDALYQMMRLDLLPQSRRNDIDKILYVQMRDRGLNWFTAKFYYRMVRRFGAAFADPANKKLVLFAP